ncbi:linker nucleoporin [Saccharomycopsis crataegensis]|uniref:Linker nucleoporin n=1 Tax=Saccharomycopsis crataegensis TaxID=43959 RepID=A0AAV5QGK8_9ASCO|nr:linker nucleoporin [Saccharomycopsis crataegensis]
MPNKICVRNGNEIFIAKQNTIRVSLNGAATSFLLILSLIDSDIKDLVLNNSGTFLAVICEFKVYAVVLPPPNAFNEINSNTPSLAVEHYQVGEFMYNKKDARILKAIWSPVAKYDSNLVVLSSDSIIRSFELGLSFQESIGSFNLRSSDPSEEKAESRETSFSLATVNSIQKPISITFGSNNLSDPVGCLTLYVFTGEGDLYSLFPFHPTKLSVDDSFVELLFNYSLVLYNKLNDCIYELMEKAENEEVDDEVEEQLHKLTLQKKNITLQLHWVSSLKQSVKSSQKEYRYDGKILKEYTILSPVTRISQLKLQGPILIDNIPNALTSEYSINGTDIISVNNGDINVLQLAFDNGDLLMLIQQYDLFMRWRLIDIENGNSEDEELDYYLTPSCGVLQYLRLSSRSKGKLAINLVPTDIPCLFFVLLDSPDRQFILKVDFFKWGRQLNNFFVDKVGVDQPQLLNEIINYQKDDNYLQIEKVYESQGRTNDQVGIDMVINDENDTFILYMVNDRTFTVDFEKHEDDLQMSSSSISTESSDEGRQFALSMRVSNSHTEFKLFEKQFRDNNFIIQKFIKDLENDPIVRKFAFVNLKEIDATFHQDLKVGQIEEFNSNLLLIVDKLAKKFVENLAFLIRYQINLGFNLTSFKEELEYQLVKLNEVIELVKKLNQSFDDENAEATGSVTPFSRLQKVFERQEKLNAKLDSLLVKVHKINSTTKSADGELFQNNLPISKVEKDFFFEMKKLSSRLNSMKINYSNASKQVSFFKNLSSESKSMGLINAASDIFDEDELTYFNKKLQKDDEALDVTKNLVKKAIEDLSEFDS